MTCNLQGSSFLKHNHHQIFHPLLNVKTDKRLFITLMLLKIGQNYNDMHCLHKDLKFTIHLINLKYWQTILSSKCNNIFYVKIFIKLRNNINYNYLHPCQGRWPFPFLYSSCQSVKRSYSNNIVFHSEIITQNKSLQLF